MRNFDTMPIAVRIFGDADQKLFARLSGDRNPIHVDPVAARRTVTGAPVVHGVHLLLWTLNALAMREPGLPPLAHLRVRFLRFTYLDDPVRAIVARQGDDELRLKITGGDTVRCDIRLTFARTQALPPYPTWTAPDLHAEGAGPIDHGGSSIDHVRGRVAIADTLDALNAAFPAVAGWLGTPRLAALAAATRLVGMIVPGLHSVLTGIDVSPCVISPDRTLAFGTKTMRHAMIDADIHGAGFAGTLTAMSPKPPVAQPGIAAMRGLVPAGAFAGTSALVVGGSRGAGAGAAKLLALGGARVVLTYTAGEEDARSVVSEIRAAGGECSVLRYDAADPAGPQLALLDEAPTHACYFASPMIARPNSKFLDTSRFAEFERIYVHGFWALAKALHGRCPDISLLYPAPAEDAAMPAGLGEYGMAKASGMALARTIDTALAPARVTIARLPWIATDQTNRLPLPDLAPAPTAILPALQAMHANRAI